MFDSTTLIYSVIIIDTMVSTDININNIKGNNINNVNIHGCSLFSCYLVIYYMHQFALFRVSYVTT